MPEVASVSARDPASIQIPTVAVCKNGEYSVATERPFDRVVVWVGRMREFAGVARPRVTRGVSGVERRRRTEETAFCIRADGMRRREADMMMTIGPGSGLDRDGEKERAVQRQLDAAETSSTTERIASMSGLQRMGRRSEMAMEMQRMADERPCLDVLAPFSGLKNR